jgi:hypothetical protein
VAGFFLILTGYRNWHGGWSLGDRYLLPVLFLAGLGLPHASGRLSNAALRGRGSFRRRRASLDDRVVGALPPRPQVAARERVALVPDPGLVRTKPVFGAGRSGADRPGERRGRRRGLALRAAAPLQPPSAAALVASLLLFGASLASPPKLGYTARLWRAAIFGAYSGQDPERRELERVVEEASTPLERRQAAGAWKLYGRP